MKKNNWLAAFSPILLTLTLFFPLCLGAAEDDTKAKDVATFPMYVDWPKEALGSAFDAFTFAVLGDEVLFKILDDSQKGKWLDGRPVAVENLRESDPASLKKMKACKVVFISVSQKGHLGGILKALKGRPVLTVSDMEGFTQDGGMIQLVPSEGRVLIQIDPKPVAKAKLKISSQLMQLAKTEKIGE